MPPVIRYVSLHTILLVFLVGMSPCPASAVQWLSLTETSRHKVAFDNDSTRLTPLGRLAVWLRFVPRGELQRRAAAADYGEKSYRYHLEYYEIDCSEQSAVLGLIDIFGTSKARLKRMKGGVQPDTIIPGSALDKTAAMICPSLDEEVLEEEPEAPTSEPTGETGSHADGHPSAEVQLQIQELATKSAEEPTNLEALRALGNAYFDADQPEQAIAVYDRALALRPDDTDILNDQGAMYRQIGAYSKALANFEKAFKIDPKNLESLYNSGYVSAFDMNDIPKALDAWRRYLKRDNSSETAKTVQSFIDRYQNNKNP